MSGLRQISLGFLAVFLSGLIIIGALTLSLTERRQGTAAAPFQTLQATPMVSQAAPQKPIASPTMSPVPSDVFPLTDATFTPTEKAAATHTPTESASEPQVDAFTATPAEPEVIEDTIYRSMLPGAFMEVPNVASIIIIQEETEPPTPTVTEQVKSNKSKSCTKPRGWVAYTVRRGDTLSQLSQRMGVSAAQIKKANCLGSNKLKVGKTIYVPLASFAPYMAPPMWQPMQPPSYNIPPKKPQSVQPTQPIIIITPNAALPVMPETSGIDHAFIGKLVYNATHF